MKIVMICDFFHESQQYQENLLAKYYMKLGHDVTIITSTISSIFDYYTAKYDKNIKSHEYRKSGFTVMRQPFSINVLNKLRKLGKLQILINKIEPDLIYVHTAPLNIGPALSYKGLNRDCIVIFDSHADFSNSANNWLSLNLLHKIVYRLVLKKYYKRLDNIFYVTPGGGDFLNRIYRIPKTHLSLLPLGVDSDYIEEIRGNRQDLRRELAIEQNDFVIFAGGKLDLRKKIELVVKSFLRLDIVNCHLIIVGDTPDLEYKQTLFDLVNRHPRVHFTGWLEGRKVYDYISVCDVAVFPASQSIIWQQAIGSGLPLIIGQSEGQDASYLNKNDSIFLIEADKVNVESISKKLRLLIENQDLLNTMKVNALKTTKEMLCYREIAKKSLILNQ
jgi:1,2-diacylglycerol 3-alpha-glucosyltransferase